MKFIPLVLLAVIALQACRDSGGHHWRYHRCSIDGFGKAACQGPEAPVEKKNGEVQ